MSLDLYDHQKLAVNRLKSGSILCGGVGSGKSRTALVYFYMKECKGLLDINGNGKWTPMRQPKDLYIITTARKRDTKEWEQECVPFLISKHGNAKNKTDLVIDSWNNIGKYTNVCNAFFIFDEQRVVGSGAWVKAFLQITKKNHWILLSATPGDTWLDYIPVFIANGFYKNRTEFIRRHVIFSRYTKYPKVDRYVEVNRLINLRQSILVNMDYIKKTERHDEYIKVDYNHTKYDAVWKDRWNIYEDKPIKNVSELLSVCRKVINSDKSRIEKTKELITQHHRLIVFYNFDYELEILRRICKENDIHTAEWNGHKHQPVPEDGSWVYLVQYTAGSEAWNCTSTNAILFYSQNYSYKVMEQSRGRIDRINTPYSDLYYYHLYSDSPLDLSIRRCLAKKKNFNENDFVQSVPKNSQSEHAIL